MKCSLKLWVFVNVDKYINVACKYVLLYPLLFYVVLCFMWNLIAAGLPWKRDLWSQGTIWLNKGLKWNEMKWTWRPSAWLISSGSLQCGCGGRREDHPTWPPRCAHRLRHVNGGNLLPQPRVPPQHEILFGVPSQGHHDHQTRPVLCKNPWTQKYTAEISPLNNGLCHSSWKKGVSVLDCSTHCSCFQQCTLHHEVSCWDR